MMMQLAHGVYEAMTCLSPSLRSPYVTQKRMRKLGRLYQATRNAERQADSDERLSSKYGSPLNDFLAGT
jgi:hypothetical protein